MDPIDDQARGMARGRPMTLTHGLAMVFVAAFGLLAGCAVGPRFVPPAAPRASGYTPVPTPAVGWTAGSNEPTQRLAMGEAPPADWWRLFHCRTLDELIERAEARNPTLDAARATLAAARAAVTETRGGYFPQVDLAAAAVRERGPAFARPLLPAGQHLPLYDLFSVGPSVSYAPDVFGLTAHTVEEREALATMRQYELQAARLTLEGQVVTQSVAIASLHLQIDTAKQIVADDARNLDLVRRKVAAGKAPRSDLPAATTQLAVDRAQLPALEQQADVAADTLAVLLGEAPGDSREPRAKLADFHLPAVLPVSLPSVLVHRRPDILAAEAAVHADSAAVGVATAQMYPNIQLSATLSTAALTTDGLFGPGSGVWALAGGVTAPLFHGGALAARRREAIDAYRGSVARYRQTVLVAFAQVADTLRALGHDAARVADERAAEDAAGTALTMQRASYAAGRSDLLQLVDAARSDRRARLGLTRAEAQRLVDSAQLLVAMGGGWWQESNR
jgi:NodT family efflux transporter outer membrane factor (OMF) lipoprotein